MTETPYDSERQYTLYVSREENQWGNYEYRVMLGDEQVKWSFGHSRDEAISAAKDFVEWHRNHDDSEEVIPL